MAVSLNIINVAPWANVLVQDLHKEFIAMYSEGHQARSRRAVVSSEYVVLGGQAPLYRKRSVVG